MNIDIRPILAFILVVILTILLFACKAKETTTERTYVSDTLKTVSLNYKSKPIDSNYTIDLICDTITGEVKPIYIKESSGDNLAELQIINNQLRAKLKTAESNTKIDSTYQSKDKEVNESKKTIIYRTPIWHWLAHVIAILIIFLIWKYF